VAWTVGIPFGPIGVVLAFSVSGFVFRLPLLYHVVGRSGPVRSADLWAGVLHNLPCPVAVYAATSVVRILVADAAPLPQLLVCGTVGVAVALAVPLAFARPRTTLRYAVATMSGHLVGRPA
jgi:PST family polysaccharide transporter